MKNTLSSVTLLLLSILLALALASPALGALESSVSVSQKLDKEPLDVVTSADGSHVYILVPGEILVYSQGGQKLEGRIPVALESTSIAAAPKGDLLYLTNGATQELSVVSVDFIYPIDVTGSAFKGPKDAPIVVAVFEDFQ